MIALLNARSRRRRDRHDRGRVRPVPRVRAARVDPDPHRADRHVDQQGGRVLDPRLDRDDGARDLHDAVPGRRRTGHAPDDRRADLRSRAVPDRRAGAADEGDRPLVPVRGVALPLHLDREHARLHPAAALRRAGDDPRRRGADARHLRSDLVDLGHARARADDVRLHAHRRPALQRPGRLLQELDPGRSEGPAR